MIIPVILPCLARCVAIGSFFFLTGYTLISVVVIISHCSPGDLFASIIQGGLLHRYQLGFALSRSSRHRTVIMMGRSLLRTYSLRDGIVEIRRLLYFLNNMKRLCHTKRREYKFVIRPRYLEA